MVKTFLTTAVLIFCLSFTKVSSADQTADRIRSDADYILSCQYMVSGDAYGAINNVQGLPTWVVPRENGMAILGLILAAEHLNNDIYLERAQVAADYLIRIQLADGSWCNQYGYATPGDINNPENKEALAKSPTMTAEVMIALYKLGYVEARYNAVKKGAQYLMECQKVANKGGNDDGLICGGKDDVGNFRTWRWSTDNSYGYQALKAAEGWARIKGENSFADECSLAAERVLNGVDNYLYHAPVWYVAIDQWGNPQGNPDLPEPYKSLPHWISYAPQMMDLPAKGVNAPEVAEWIKNSFQQTNGGCIGYQYEAGLLRTREYPGLSFQAAFCWFDLGKNSHAQNAINWAYNSGLQHANGGWIDWVEVTPETGRREAEWMRFIDTSFYAIAVLKGGYNFNTFKTLNLDVPWYQNTAPYNSTGAAAAQMILNYIRKGVVEPFTELSQNEIYEYAKGTNPRTSDLTPDEIAKVLGHFDPYDAIVSGWADSYDSLPGGNPYQGYNFSAEAFDPNSDSGAINKYMRDICHWMAYTVTKTDWWLNGDLVVHPNTPAAVPILGSYIHWVCVKGFAVSADPAPFPHLNPWSFPDFTIYGFWLKDPLITGIGQDTYKTASECASTYFLPLNTSDKYQGKFLQVAEPPPVESAATVKISGPVSDLGNLRYAGIQTASLTIQSKALSLANSIAGFTRKRSWQEIVGPYLLTDKEAVGAFTGAVRGQAILVKRLDNDDNYYLVPFYKKTSKWHLVSAVIVLDAQNGSFKEAAWTKQPQVLLKVDKRRAVVLVKNSIIGDIDKMRIDSLLVMAYRSLMNYIDGAEIDLVWQPNSYSLSVYSPYWKINSFGYTWFVTQDGQVFATTSTKSILNEIIRNKLISRDQIR